MTETNLNFAKIVANPTTSSWSQVYGAGKLFAAISLEKKEETEEKDYLNVLGKDILNTLEQEFFTLEIKDLDSIRQAVLTTSEKIPQDVTLSFVIGVVVNNILYVYILGNGKADIKRGEKIGTLLEAKDQQGNALKEASGYLQQNDILVLETEQFTSVISESMLSEFLDNPNIADAAENLAPLIHEKDNAGASAIMVSYKEPVADETLETITAPTEEEKVSGENVQKPSQDKDTYFAPSPKQSTGFGQKVSGILPAILGKFTLPKASGLSHPRKVILTIVILIVIVFVASIFFAIQKQQNDKVLSDFNSIYPQAEKKYEEGQSLVDLNQSLAKDSFDQAKTILENGKSKFSADSSQEKQILTLLTKVNTALGSQAKSTTITAQPVSNDLSPYLSLELKNNALDYTQDTNNVYLITSSAISSVAKTATTPKVLVKNSTDWKSVGGFATYNTNLYVVDKDQNSIVKLTNSGSAYSSSDYLTATAKPDFSKAVSAAIDNNIYVLSSDGSVDKFFKGNSVDFALKGLDKSLSSPTKIYTTPDFDNIYILDNGNSRIVVVDKTGSFKAQYSSPVIKTAKDFDVLESSKTAYVLSNGKIYKISL